MHIQFYSSATSAYQFHYDLKLFNPMQFLNPFDLINSDFDSISEITPSILKKEKRKVIADVELSEDNSILISRIRFYKAECINALNELEEPLKLKFYFFLSKYPELNNFLYRSDPEFFYTLRHDKIFDSPDFIAFIEPYFAKSYNAALVQALRINDHPTLKLINSFPLLSTGKNTDQFFQDTYHYLQDKINTLDDISNKLEADNRSYNKNNINELIHLIRNLIDTQSLNLLPSYFQSI
ncbi:hypothetical protein JXJ21_25610, partial [candidate division KSB1 bacterium]|nr:hypothetical protein [candidate division KSB1 bacterium]